MKKLKINCKTSSQESLYSENCDGFECRTYEIENNRAISKSEIIIITENEIAQVIFEDGTDWIGKASELPDIFGGHLKKSLESPEIFELPGEITFTDSTRNIFNKVKTKALNVFKIKAAKYLAENLGQHFDKKIMPKPGLKIVNKNLITEIPETSLKDNGKYLLFLHGTISSTTGSFGKLPAHLVDELFTQYDEVIALDHYTLSVSPLENARDVLENLPKNARLDIISHSRGGLIADLLARCDKSDNDAFSPEEIDILKNSGDKNSEELCQKLNALAKEKQITVSKMVRVACPAAGTTLLSKKIDHYLNALLNSVGYLTGKNDSPIYQIIKELILNVVAQKSEPKILPGLWAMVPDSEYQKFNNYPLRNISTHTFIISGDSEVGGSLLQTLGVILSNLFYKTANDFVVNTSSMHQGVRRTNGYYKFLSKDSSTHHFGYFANAHTAHAVFHALTSTIPDGEFTVSNIKYKYEFISRYSTDRGVALQLLGNKPYNSKAQGNKPVAIILPGIMGSTIDANNNNIWLNVGQLFKGALVDQLNLGNNNVQASGLIDRYYKKLCEYLKSDFDVHTFAYDWRDSLSTSAIKLMTEIDKFSADPNRKIVLLAHSMGGKVVKSVMMEHQNFWKTYIKREGSKVLMLGTPWMGSHLIMEVLTGHSKRVKQLGFLDFKHNNDEILKTITEYKGIWQLLPVNDQDFEAMSFWNKFSKTDANIKHILSSPNLLEHFKEYKKNQLEFEGKTTSSDFHNIFYIAGSDKTVCAYTIENNNKLRYLTTKAGDGSVTYELGIPKSIPASNIYSCKVTHGMLAAEPKIFDAINDILKNGQTSRLRPGMPDLRSMEALEPMDDNCIFSTDEIEAMDIILGCESLSYEKEIQEIPEINVHVLNADLKYAYYPVMVGHFENDGIMSAEKALDGYLGNKLSDRHRLGFYPGKIGESEIPFQRDSIPKGALVVGLGSQDELTQYRLALSIEKAIIRYAFFFRDNYTMTDIKQQSIGISSMLIGSNYAGLPLMDSIRSIIQGVTNANKKLLGMNNGLLIIREIQFVDFWEDMAQGTQKLLYKLRDNAPELALHVKPLKEDHGKKRRLSLQDNASWWHTFTTTSIWSKDIDKKEVQGLAFSSSGNRARIEQDDISGDLRMVEFLNNKFAHHSRWDAKLAKTLFELLIPNDFKGIIRNQAKILWKLDDYSAQFPWEMFHDSMYGEEPTFINASLIRQLHTADYRINPALVGRRTALVIGNPDYQNTYSQLPGAEIEARLVSNKLKQQNYWVNESIFMPAQDIVTKMYSEEYKIVHIAAHGIHTPDKTGIVIGPDILLTPAMLNQLSVIPELVFVNCCYSGNTANFEDQLIKGRNKLAANVGIQLIQIGVKAVVVCGWAVDDKAAEVFARKFYDKMLEGSEFGAAVQLARKACYQSDPGSNTWGAYQCYGDPFYRLEFKNGWTTDNVEYIYSAEAENELRNMLSALQGKKEKREMFVQKLNLLVERIYKNNAGSPEITELIAHIQASLGNYAEAVKLMHELLFHEKADFKVSTLEQYCSLRGKLFLEMFDNNIKLPNGALEKLIRDIELIQNVGPTAERYALKGSAEKRLIILDPAKNVDHAKNMSQAFHESFELMKNMPAEKYMYPLSNYLIAVWYINKNENKEPTIPKFVNKYINN
ncbi:MAG: CHAT domain-containing protein [Saprospiraceae bacterium]|nr:CHAT domain-containing protein [Saprospiraceae bacterium]